MEREVYRSFDTTILPIIEQALRDHEIPYLVTGAADVGLAINQEIRINVRDQDFERAREIIDKLEGK